MHVPIRIILVAYLSAITIIKYNRLAPMYTPKLQLNTDQGPELQCLLKVKVDLN